MYSDKMVVVVKVDGKILREIDGTVHIPFNKEYSLSFKNLNSRKASAKVFIDGTDVLEGKSLVINPNEETSLERFIKDDNLNNGNRFKFIQKSKEISEHRGDKIDDGLIRIEFKFEKEQPITTWAIYNVPLTVHRNFPIYGPIYDRVVKYDNPDGYVYGTICENHMELCDNMTNDFVTNRSSEVFGNSNVRSFASKVCEGDEKPLQDMDNGITVKGSVSNQGFNYGFIGELEDQSHIIIFKLKGVNSNEIKIVRPITIKTKIQCETCGKKSRSDKKFCSNCGTSLI